MELDSPLNLSGTQAPSADPDSFRSTVDQGFYPLEVRTPGFLGPDMGMADSHTGYNTFITNFASCHI